MFRFLMITLVLQGLLLSVGAEGRFYGLERMARLDRLPYLFEGTQVRQVSSYDRSGGNDDGFKGTYSTLYIDEKGEYVLFDEVGAGCLYRFWMTYGTSPADYPDYRLRFYFDNETSPRLDLSITEFFDGVGAPLEFPLVGPFNKSSHGCYCYLPFPYKDRLKITLSGKPLFYNMIYHRFDSSEGVVSWTGNEDQSAVLGQWNAVGSDPKEAVSNQVVSGDFSLTAGSTGTLFQVAGGGVIQSITLDPSPNTEAILSNVWIQMNWDEGELEVDVPLGDFFGSGKREVNVTSLPIGMRTAGDWYCYFPMPYWTSAKIRVVNKGDQALTSLPFEVQYSTNIYDRATAGYFHALFHEESFVGNGRDFNFINEQGRGHVVGVSLFMESFGAGGYRNMNYLEGDERAYVDGNQSPCIHGTGNEDYFNCGWYFNKGTFSRPYHGHPWRDQFHNTATNYTQAYRFHISDTIPFNQSVKFGIEHGHGNASPGTYSSVTYYYKVAGHTTGLVPVANLNLGDAWAESLYNYQSADDAVTISNEWRYGGDEDDVRVLDAGYSYSNAMTSFSIPVVACEGILLRRRTDHGVGGQKAVVSVDGVDVGVWYEADHTFLSTSNRWLDSEFMIPASFVAGKTNVQIRISSSNTWNECHYWIYCLKPLQVIEDSDADHLPDAWELDHVSTLNILRADTDFDSDGICDLGEYTAGTAPDDAEDFPQILVDKKGGSVWFSSKRGHLYTVQESSNLTANSWMPVRSDIPGTGAMLAVPCSALAPSSYYRFIVTKP